jgi:hypothetical protein
MDRRALAALLAGLISVAAIASVSAPARDAAHAALAAPVTAETGAGRRCLWRIAFRAPSRLYFGCRWSDTLAATTHWLDLDPAALADLATLAAAIVGGANARPVSISLPVSGQQPTLCDRYWLWAEDEGPRAPEMTRERKIRQACAEDRP